MQNKQEEIAALYSIDDTNKEAYESDDWFIATGNSQAAWTSLAYATYQRFFLTSLGFPVVAAEILADERKLMEHMHTVYELRPHVRISRTGKNFAVYLPVAGGAMDFRDLLTPQNRWSFDPQPILDRLEDKIPGITDPTAAIDMRLPTTLLNLPFTGKDLGFENEDEFAQLKASIHGIRFCAAPNVKKFEQTVDASTLDNWAAGTADLAQKRSYLQKIMSTRQGVMFMELGVSAAAATHICQGEPTLGVLGEYFGKMLEWLFGDDRSYVHNIVPISKIAAVNAQSGYTPVSRTDENGLTVDSKGRVMWLPDVDNSEFVEAEIEQGGLQPDGDWTRVDAVNPEVNEYITVPGQGGRMRKPKGRMKLIYTDWHNARLSYTNDSGQLELLDLSMFRKATPGQLAKILSAHITEAGGIDSVSASANLAFAVERAHSLGITIAYDPAHFEGFLNEEDAKEALGVLNAGKFAEYLLQCDRAMREVHNNGRGSRPWTPEQINALDAVYDKWVMLDAISVNSPLIMLRPLAMMLNQTFDSIMVDPAAVFGRYTVPNTLREIATLSVVAKYAGQYEALRLKDATTRAKYLTPDLVPTNEVEVKDIPFVSGSVELFPHQVKAWNWLKNAPENVVLDVAAGGGKTLLALLDIAYHIGLGMKRPLVICPGDLIKNYINDAQWLFKGKMNMVVLNGTTFNSKEWGEDALRDLANNAPVNSIFLTDYDFIIPKKGSARMVTAMYGTEEINISLNNEFLKSIEWGGIWMDESHKTKNMYSSTNKELQRLVSTIPFKRQLSGTYISDSLTDVVGEFSLMNPQTFGTMEDFEDAYFPNGKKSAPKPGAQRMIYDAMAQNANVITIRRKEWAAILPRRRDNFYPVHMTAGQQTVYQEILDVQEKELNDKLARDTELRSVLHDGVDENGKAYTAAELLDGQLDFVFQRLEQFVTAPSSDPLGKGLAGDDRKSPKLAMIEKIVRDHMAGVLGHEPHPQYPDDRNRDRPVMTADGKQVPGKILVWTQYVESAANIFKMLSPDLQAKAVYYTSGNADMAMQEFESNPGKIMMIGCEKTMNTGHNLQYCSRIIRLETVWNWGTLEQGESRINRPQLNDPRRHENGGYGIFYDWVFCDKSIDVTKNARMISKLISTIKFYERDNQAYIDLPDVEPVRLSKKNIFAINSWDDPDPEKGCAAHFEAYEQYQQLEQIEFDKFVDDPENRMEGYTLEEGAILTGAGLLKRIPYVPQMKIYGQEQLGLIPFLEYISTEYSDKKKTVLLINDPAWTPADLKIHCEYGDCVAKGYTVGNKRIRLLAPDGSTVSTPITMAWVITKDVANGSEMREAIGKRIGADVKNEVVPKQIKVLKPGAIGDGSKHGTRGPQDNAGEGFEVFLDTYNEFLSLVLNSTDTDVAANIRDIEALGFIQIPDYNYTRVKAFKTLGLWMAAVQKKVTIHPRFLQELEEQLALWTKHKTMDKFAAGLASGSKKRFLTEQRNAAPKGEIRPYLVTHNDEVFLCLNVKVNAASFGKVKTAAVPGIVWKQVSGEHWLFARSKQEVQTVLKQMFNKYNITNRKLVVDDLAAARIVKVN